MTATFTFTSGTLYDQTNTIIGVIIYDHGDHTPSASEYDFFEYAPPARMTGRIVRRMADIADRFAFEMAQFASTLKNCRAPLAVMTRWLSEIQLTRPEPRARAIDSLVVAKRPLSRPRPRSIHHGAALLNFHRIS